MIRKVIIRKIQEIINKLFIICAKLINTSLWPKNIYFKNIYSYRSSFLLPLIIKKLEGDITSESEPIIRYLSAITILCIIALFCFINVFGYIFSLYLIPKFELDKKFPSLRKLISFYEKSSFYLIVIEIIIGFTFLSFVIVLNTALCVSLIQ